MKRAMADAALAVPTEPEAAARVKAGNRHHRDGLRLAEIVDTQPNARAAFERAIEEYIQARAQSPAPSILFNVAQSYRAAGEYQKAIDQYRLFLERGQPRASLRGVVECLIANMQAELARAAASQPPRDAAPTVTDERRDSPPPAPAPSPAPEIQRAVVELPPPSAPSPWHSDRLGWGLTGAGLVAAGAGVYLLAQASDLNQQANDEPRDDLRPALREKSESRQLWGTIITATGGGLVLVGVIKLAIHPSSATSARATLRLTPGGLAVQGRF
jgi:tetratricopeptide (TPR) repeat protein